MRRMGRAACVLAVTLAIDGSSRAVQGFRTPGTAAVAVKLDASSAVAAALFSTLDRDPLMAVFAGPPLGPLAPLGPLPERVIESSS
jgi:hypothetical protein